MPQFIRENLKFLLLPLIILIVGLVMVIPQVQPSLEAVQQKFALDKELISAKQELDDLKFQSTQKIEKVLDGDKKIYQAMGLQFSPDASFAPLFETVINIAKISGIRIRSIDYNYNPQEDDILKAKLPNYNVCELAIVAVGSYTQFQNFYKALVKEEYLNNIASIEVRPFKEDRSVLVTSMKIRLYTKTGGESQTPQPPAMDQPI